jgi:hypothetical protein
MTDLTWNLRLPVRIREQIEPLARADGRDASQMARRLLELAVRERATQGHRR